MATVGTPYEGRDNIIGPAVYVATLQARLYTNTQDSLDSATVFADMTEPSGTGYAAITLNGSWGFNNGVFTYDHGTPDDPVWENTGGTTWTGGDVTGIWITDGTYVLHFKDLTAGPVEMVAGAELQLDLSTQN